MIIPKYNRALNSYAQKFIDNLYENLEIHYNVNEILDIKKRNIINQITARYYCIYFSAMHKDNYKLKHHPELADKFNAFYSHIIYSAIDICFFTTYNPPLTDERLKTTFEKLIRKVGLKMQDYNDNKELSEAEIISQLTDYTRKEYENMLKDYNFSERDCLDPFYTYTLNRIRQEFSGELEKLKVKINQVINYDNSAGKIAMLVTVVPFCLLFFFIPLANILFAKNAEKIPAIILVSFFYLTFFTIFGICTLQTYKVKRKLDYIEKYNEYYGQYHRLGVDVLKIEISKSLSDYTDIDKQNEIIPVISDFRLNLTDEYGIVLPGVRLKVNENLDDNKISIFVRNKNILTTDFYTDRHIINKNNIDKIKKDLPEDKIEITIFDNTYYWIKEKFFNDIDKNIYMTRNDFLKYILNNITFSYIDKIFTSIEAFCLLQLVKANIKSGDTESQNALNATDFSIFDFHDIFLKIIQKGGSLKDINYVYEKIVYYSNKSKDKDFIAFSVCQDLAFSKK